MVINKTSPNEWLIISIKLHNKFSVIFFLTDQRLDGTQLIQRSASELVSKEMLLRYWAAVRPSKSSIVSMPPSPAMSESVLMVESLSCPSAGENEASSHEDIEQQKTPEFCRKVLGQQC